MRLKQLPLILCVSISVWVEAAQAQSNDPSDYFLNAFTAYQKAEKADGSGNAKAALQSYKDASRILDQISSRWPNWNPSIVDFRRKRTAEAITKLQAKVGGAAQAEGPGGGDGGLMPPPSGAGVDDSLILPQDSFVPEAPVTLQSERGSRRGAGPASAGADPVEEIRRRMEDLTKNLQQSNSDLEKLRQEKDDLGKQLRDSNAAREKSENQQKLLQQRADLAEAKLVEAKGKGTQDAESIYVLQTERDKARKNLRDLQFDREAAEEVRQQISSRLTKAQARAVTLQGERDAASKLSAEAAVKIADAQKKMEAAIKERDALSLKLTTVMRERDDALSQVAKMREDQKRVDKLIADNTELMAKLDVAEKQITQFKADSVQKDIVIADLKKEVGSAQKQLAAAKTESAQFQVQMADLQQKLDATGKEISKMKTDSVASTSERKKMGEENEILRGIVMRQMKEQARRDQTRKLVLGEVLKLDIKSKELISQINTLGQPVVKLTEKERALFKKPQIEISDNEISLAAPKPDETAVAAAAPAPTPTPAAPAAPSPDAGATNAAATELPMPAGNVAANASPGPTATPAVEAPPAPVPAEQQPVLSLENPPGEILLAKNTPPAMPTALKPAETTPSPAPTDELPVKESGVTSDDPALGMSSSASTAGIPSELMATVQEAKEHFEKGNYRDAEKLYEKVLAKAPNNLYALSNLGVVRFRGGKLAGAEAAFKKALAIAPEDAFSRCTLGIVYYSQMNYDDAVNELTKALAINPKNATAHNYLGITASQKGWQEAAQKELETATALDPQYADAHFNLAVVYATQQPPNKELARKFYKRAVELGAEADSALEALIK